MKPKPVFIVTGRHRPHHILLLLYSLVIGAAILAGLVPQPRTMAQQLDPVQVTLWAAGLTASGLLGLIGAFWRGEPGRGLRLERSSMLLGAGAVFGFAWSVSQLGRVAAFSTGFCIAWGIANLFLVKYIGEDLRNLGKVERDGGVRAGPVGEPGHRRPFWRRNRGSNQGVQSPPPREGGHDRHLE